MRCNVSDARTPWHAKDSRIGPSKSVHPEACADRGVDIPLNWQIQSRWIVVVCHNVTGAIKNVIALRSSPSGVTIVVGSDGATDRLMTSVVVGRNLSLRCSVPLRKSVRFPSECSTDTVRVTVNGEGFDSTFNDAWRIK